VTLPEDDIPIEILATVMHNDDVGVINAEKDSYVPDNEAGPLDVSKNGKYSLSKKKKYMLKSSPCRCRSRHCTTSVSW